MTERKKAHSQNGINLMDKTEDSATCTSQNYVRVFVGLHFTPGRETPWSMTEQHHHPSISSSTITWSDLNPPWSVMGSTEAVKGIRDASTHTQTHAWALDKWGIYLVSDLVAVFEKVRDKVLYIKPGCLSSPYWLLILTKAIVMDNSGQQSQVIL